MVHRKYANYPDWNRILKHRYYGTFLDTPEFRGQITLYCMDAVSGPLTVPYFHRITTIVDSGYSWLKQFPADHQHYAVTTHFDACGNVVLWYIDICLRTGVGEDGIPWLDDLYLDLVVSPAMEIEVKDCDELLAALENGDISPDEYDLAWREAEKLIEQIIKNQLYLLPLSTSHRQSLLQLKPMRMISP